MVNNRVPSVFSKTYVTPRRPLKKHVLIKRSVKLLVSCSPLEEKDPKRLFEGNALLRRLISWNVALQTQVFKAGLAKSIHHARILIRQRHIRVRKQVVNIPSFIVRLDSGKHIDFSLKSPFGGGRPGRVKRKNLRKGQGGGATNDEEED
ncbi:hypothetical protein ACJJTC_005697 [Scirpophaga incertulas]